MEQMPCATAPIGWKPVNILYNLLRALLEYQMLKDNHFLTDAFIIRP